MPKKTEKSYYVVSSVETITRFNAESDEEAQKKAEEITENLEVSMCELASLEYQGLDIEVSNRTVEEVLDD